MNFYLWRRQKVFRYEETSNKYEEDSSCDDALIGDENEPSQLPKIFNLDFNKEMIATEPFKSPDMFPKYSVEQFADLKAYLKNCRSISVSAADNNLI